VVVVPWVIVLIGAHSLPLSFSLSSCWVVPLSPSLSLLVVVVVWVGSGLHLPGVEVRVGGVGLGLSTVVKFDEVVAQLGVSASQGSSLQEARRLWASTEAGQLPGYGVAGDHSQR